MQGGSLSTGDKLDSFVQKDRLDRKKVGRPERHESERMKTIAWFHFFVGDGSPSRAFDFEPFLQFDSATIYRYRNGQSSPSARLLDADDDFFRMAKGVYENGPLCVPLWESMWGPSPPADYLVAERMMPRGEWPNWSLSHLFDDAVAGHVLDFHFQRMRETRVRRNFSEFDQLETFAFAARVFRVHQELGRGKTQALRELLEAAHSLPGARLLLKNTGLLTATAEWVEAQLDNISIKTNAGEFRTAWMTDRHVFYEMCELAEVRKAATKEGILSIFRRD